MKTWIKRESLFFKTCRNYKGGSNGRFRRRRFCGDVIAPTGGKLKMQTSNTDVQTRVLALVKAILEQNAIAADVHPESRLVDVGLTSMDMVNLMLGVEAEFDFTIPQAEITPENFQSIKTLERMVVGQLQAAQAA
jgi:acyl carrier protein